MIVGIYMLRLRQDGIGTVGALWERCGSAVGALWEHCGTTVAALWGRCIPAVGQNITQNIKKCVFPIPSQ